jgi:outer membrane protein
MLKNNKRHPPGNRMHDLLVKCTVHSAMHNEYKYRMRKISRTQWSVLWYFLVILIWIPVQGQAQQEIWSLDKCIQYAIEHNISINQKVLNNKLLDIDLAQSKASLLPSLNASASQGYSFGRSVDPYTNDYIEQNVGSSNFSVNSNVTVFNGFQSLNTIRQNQLDMKSGELDLEQLKKDITLNISEAYLQVLFLYEQVDNARQKVAKTEAQMETTSRMVRAGLQAESNLFQMRSQLATDKYSLVSYENQLSMAKISLMQLMEYPVIDSFNISQPVIDTLAYNEENLRSSWEYYQAALATQPQVQSSELKVSSAEKALEIARGAMYPRLSLSAGLNSGYSDARNLYSRTFSTEEREIGYLQSNPAEKVMAMQQVATTKTLNYPFDQQLIDNFSESVRLSLSIPIFSNKSIKSNISRSKIQIMNAQLNELSVKNQVRKNIEQAYQDLQGAYNNYYAATEQLYSAEKAFNDSGRKYELGMINATDYLIEQNNYFTARSNLTRAKYNFLFMQKILDFYMGNPITLE